MDKEQHDNIIYSTPDGNTNVSIYSLEMMIEYRELKNKQL